MNLSIITINYNATKETIGLLSSLKLQSDDNFNVTVIDNNSLSNEANDLIDWVKNNYLQIKLVTLKDNLGFSGGCNVGIKEALKNGAEWILLLNNDTCPENTFIADLRAVLSDIEASELTKGMIIGLPINEGIRTVYGGRVEWLKETLPHITQTFGQDSNFYTIGGAMLIHKKVFETIGYLDEKYFLYFEDADFCLRAKENKIPLRILREPEVRHEVSASTKKLGSPQLLYYHYRNSLRFNMRHGPTAVKILLPFWSLLIIAKQIGKITLGWQTEKSRHILRGVFDFYRNRFGKF